MTERTIDVDGVAVAVTDEGEGRPLVFLHGGSRTLADWLFVTPQLVDDFRVVCVDFRGHGRSQSVPTWGIDDGVADTRGVIDALDIPDAIVIGHSLGGMTAIRYAANGNPCAGVVNVDGFGTGHPSEFVGYAEDDARARLEKFADLSEQGFREGGDTGDEAWMEERVAQMRTATESMGLDWATTEPLVRRGYRQLDDGTWKTSPSADVNASMYRSLFMVDHWADYERLAVPMLVIRSTNGGDSGLEDPEDVKFLEAFDLGLAQRLDAWEAAADDHYLERMHTGHMVMWEMPNEVVDAVRRFADVVDAPR